MTSRKCSNPGLPHLFQCGCGRWVEEGDRPTHLPAYASENEMREVFIPAMREWLEEDAQLTGASTLADEEVLEAVHYEYYGGIAAFVADEGDRRYLASTSKEVKA